MFVPFPLWTNINSSSTESYKNEPEEPAEPESNIAIPPNLTDGWFTFNWMMLSPISKRDELMFCIDDEPCTIKSCVIYNEPLIVWVWVNVLLTLVLANEPVSDSVTQLPLSAPILFHLVSFEPV